jgi:hypothetical protein
MNHSLRFFVVVALAFTAMSASAGLVGTVVKQCADTVRNVGSVTTDISVCGHGVQPTPASALVGAGIEFSASGRTLDFGNDTLTITYNNTGSASPDLYIFFDLLDDVTGLSLIGSNPLNATWAFISDRIAVQINDPLQNGAVDFRITFGGSVPEPSTAALVLLPLLAMAKRFGRRTRQSAPTLV